MSRAAKTPKLHTSPQIARTSQASYLPLVDRIEFILSCVLKIVLVLATVYAFVHSDYFHILSAIGALVASAMPAIIGRRWRLVLPVELDFFVTCFICAHLVLGELGGYYTRYWWFDMALHSISGFILGLVGFVWAYTLFYTHKIQAQAGFIVVFSISLAMAAGGTWEIFEYAMDHIFGFNMQKTGLDDTMEDLIVDLIASLVVGALGYLYLKTHRDGLIRRVLLHVENRAAQARKARASADS